MNTNPAPKQETIAAPEDHDEYDDTHRVPRSETERSLKWGLPATALCGRTWVIQNAEVRGNAARRGSGSRICPRCFEIEMIRAGLEL